MILDTINGMPQFSRNQWDIVTICDNGNDSSYFKVFTTNKTAIAHE